MLLEENYRPNTPNVIHEIINGEAVMINLEKGYYYSLDPTGSAIWQLLDQGMTVSQIVIVLQQQYAGSQTMFETGIHDFFLQLQTENLIVSYERPERSKDVIEQSAAGTNSDGMGQNQAAFVAPMLHKYTDIEDLLLLDPIHEVDETGWPAVPDNG